MNRKIIQIATRPQNEEVTSIIALADDGTLWEGYTRRVCDKQAVYDEKGKQISAAVYHYEFQWEQLRELPGNVSNLTKVR